MVQTFGLEVEWKDEGQCWTVGRVFEAGPVMNGLWVIGKRSRVHLVRTLVPGLG